MEELGADILLPTELHEDRGAPPPHLRDFTTTMYTAHISKEFRVLSHPSTLGLALELLQPLPQGARAHSPFKVERSIHLLIRLSVL